MNTILLFIIGIFLIGDLYFLRRIYKQGKNGKEIFSDEKYYELKFSINLLKAISAILIFVIGFLGYSTIKDFSDNLEKDTNKQIGDQKKEIIKISKNIENIKLSVDSLENLKKNFEDVIKTYESNLKNVNKKISNIKTSLKYNPRIYIVNDLKFYKSNFNRNNLLIIYFKDLLTIFGEHLPDFRKTPYINIQGHNIEINIQKVTNTYVEFISNSHDGFGIKDESKNENYFNFDIWIASFD